MSCRMPFDVGKRGTFVLVHIAAYTGYGPRFAISARHTVQHILAKRLRGLDWGKLEMAGRTMSSSACP